MALTLLKRRWILTVVGFVLIGAVIWFAGPYFAFAEIYPLASPLARVVATAAVVAVWASLALLTRLRKGRATSAFLSGAAKPAGGSQLTPGEAVQLQERFDQAIATLKQSERRGKSLYDLPWYVFIGAPGAGKTTALLKSGLTFPLERRLGQAALKGVAGTRNCDWWFTDEAVFLDTAGRYTTQDSDAEADSAGWLAFLGLLRQYRKRRPLNGVILTFSARDLLTAPGDVREKQVPAARRRLEELRRELRIQLPVYVLVTKCDLLAGFSEYFDDLSAQARAEVLGLTFDAGLTERGDAPAAFAGEFAALVERLNRRVLGRLDAESDARRRTRILGFPQQLVALRDELQDVVTGVFSSTTFDRRVLLRGVYFTSGTQEGTPIDRLLSIVGRGLSAPAEAQTSAWGRGKAYFIERFLKDVLIPEAGLAGIDRRQELRQAAWQMGVYGALALAGVLGVTALTISYQRNQTYLREVSAALGGLTEQPVAGASLDLVLPWLDQLDQIATVANKHREHVPLWMRWGLFQGRAVGTSATDAYVAHLDATLGPYLARRIERRLVDTAGDPDALYLYLKAYLMLGQPEHLDRDFLAAVAHEEWQQLTPALVASFDRHFEALLAAEQHQLRPIALDAGLVERARTSIRLASLPQLVFNRLHFARQVHPSRTLRLDTAAGAGVAALRLDHGRSLSDPVPDLYTAAGFRDITGSGAAGILEEFRNESWVWGEDAPQIRDTARLQADVLALYEGKYIEWWDRLLADLGVAPFSLSGNTLSVLASPSSPLRALLRVVDENTFLVKPAEAAPPASGVVATTRDMLRRALPGRSGPSSAVPQIPGQRITDHFAAVHALVSGPDGAAPIDRVLTELAELNQALLAAGAGPGGQTSLQLVASGQIQTRARALRQGSGLLPGIGGVITQVADRVQTAATSGATNDLANLYRQDVVRECAAILDGHYPFGPGGSDVPLGDFTRLFGPGGVFDKFFADHIDSLADRSRSPWSWRPNSVALPSSILQQFERAGEIRDLFFPQGARSPVVPFNVTIETLTFPATRFVLEIDGQRFEFFNASPRTLRATWPSDNPGPTAFAFEDRSSVRPNAVFPGPWGLFKLLDAAAVEPSGATTTVRVSLGGYSARVKLDAERGRNPFSNTSWRRFRCG